MNGLPRPPLDQISGSEDETECSSIFRPLYLCSKGEGGVAGRRGGVGGRTGGRDRVRGGCEEREGEKEEGKDMRVGSCPSEVDGSNNQHHKGGIANLALPSQ